ncbi:DDE-type integrase/transposase/recombinase [uncultured Martelella sp.]|uniref:DDE-type integrase/transposase/recombinase n=1 Tax=uncultured Martelella sp. TaxID=392331 RepID=UPI002D1E4906|nr:DDE-type integrase/transposase/recombinase [uncultured Martelella sp.]
MARGFVYLCAVIDWFSRRVLSWKLLITLETAFCIEAVEEALGRYGKPEIFNSDQGSQFTSIDFTGVSKMPRSRYRWVAREHGATMSLSNGCGDLSSMKRFIFTPTSLLPKPGRVSGDI